LSVLKSCFCCVGDLNYISKYEKKEGKKKFLANILVIIVEKKEGDSFVKPL